MERERNWEMVASGAGSGESVRVCVCVKRMIGHLLASSLCPHRNSSTDKRETGRIGAGVGVRGD